MNKYQKNMLWFNIEKLIATIIALSFIILMAVTLNSCNSERVLTKEYHHQQYCDACQYMFQK